MPMGRCVLAVAANMYALSLPVDDHFECMSGLPLGASELLLLFDTQAAAAATLSSYAPSQEHDASMQDFLITLMSSAR